MEFDVRNGKRQRIQRSLEVKNGKRQHLKQWKQKTATLWTHVYPIAFISMLHNDSQAKSSSLNVQVHIANTLLEFNHKSIIECAIINHCFF